MTLDNIRSNPNTVDLDDIALDRETRKALGRLQNQGYDETDLSSHSLRRLAAVLVLLYWHAGALRVLLTTRSKNLRSHPGQTALPGGRVDEEDRDAVETAFREANEEVALPFPTSLKSNIGPATPTTPHIHTLCSLSPHLSQWGLVVTPVIAYLSSPSANKSPHTFLQSTLRANPDEVDRIFTHPLEALLDPQLLADSVLLSGENNLDPGPPSAGHEMAAGDIGSDMSAGDTTRVPLEPEIINSGLNFEAVKLAESGGEDWPYEEEYYNTTDRLYPELGNTVYRMHRFRSSASPIKGLTAEILMRVAAIAYDKPPKPPIEQYAPGQIRGFEEISRVLQQYGAKGTRVN
ncbi:hypothetical protein GYMLUDRAFT_42070 [Collybiopsis luxurians FD-317 M1]|uniref:Nudix hydrolase domain-containing protein n=1 Tax=Collybiopsis luxurians FD-317 M1 TaxID=944289 RepID=A0A0D0BFI2_9AGAR|nr:hypothetical protein GYMLUDRAFT_42070 [Collybiopsis luxurians FD-317 M1]